jgi:glutamate 5-kinase
LVVDDGAKKAIRERGKSLLPPGLRRCEGEFAAGDVVRVCDLEGVEFARGQAAFAAGEVRGGKLRRVEIIHRDNLVVL